MRDALLPIPTFDSQLPWFALQVNSRKENWIFAHLVVQGYECFLPKYKSVRKWSDRRKEIESPLFPGYLFCRFNPLERLPILKTPGVMGIVGCNRKPIAIDEQEIQAIQRMMESSLVRQPWPYLEVGQQVRIQSGALRGLVGILVALKGNYRLVLSVTLLKRSVACGDRCGCSSGVES
ncbi:MAG: NusG-like protein [Acidobacteria bacterium]|nr:MAG: NusG-like protein [Acidobacteriota bacterium]